jgi:hypothetical protein
VNGNWFIYSQQPTLYVQKWQDLTNKIRAATKRVSMMWSPNSADNYPFGSPMAGAEIGALDTNKNGALDNGDDPYAPYWPGEGYV